MEKTYESISKRQIILWLVIRTLSFAIFAAIFFIVRSIIFSSDLGNAKSDVELWYNTLIVVLLVLMGINAFVMPFFQQRFWQYRIDDEKIEIKHGVITVILHALPVARIQQITVVRTILNRIFGLSTIMVETAGNQQIIIGIEKDKAESLAKMLNERVNHIANDDPEASTI